MSDILPEGFQMTELGPLPKEWRVVRLGEVANVMQGRTPKRDLYDDKRGYRIIKVKDFQDGEKIAVTPSGDRSFVSVDLGAPFRVRTDDVLILNSGHSSGVVGQKVGIVPPELEGAFYVAELTAIRALNDASNSFYIFSCLMHPEQRERIRALVKGGHLYAEQLRSLPIPLPPLPEQRAIAQVLRTVQRAKEATDGVIAALKELKKSLMQHLFTYGPVPVGAKDFSPQRETEIGPIPAHWQVVRLGEVAALSTRAIEPANAGAKRYIGLEHIDPGNTRIQHWGKANDVRSLKTAFQQGDVLYGKLRPYLDKAVLAEWDGICSTDILVIKAQNGLLPEFLAYLVHTSQFIEYAVSTTTGVNHPRTSWKALKKFSIPLPPLSEQREIARILQTVDAKIAAEEARRAALEELFKTLLHQLMTGQIRVPDIVGAQRGCTPTTFPNPED